MSRTAVSSAIVALALALAAGACADDPTPVEVGGDADDPVESSTTLPDEADEPPIDPPPSDDHLVAIEALLRESDVADGWDRPSFSEWDGYDVGPNQTDCDVYWELESIAAHPIVHRLWWRPGANLNHEVYDTGPEAATSLMTAASALAKACPVLSWGEGDTMPITSLALDVPNVVAHELLTGPGEITWQAYASRGNLVSRLWRVHFEPGAVPGPDALAEFESLVALMVERLAGGRSAQPSRTTQPGTTLPGTLPPVTTTLPGTRPPVTTTLPGTLPPLPTTTEPAPVADHPLLGALLTDNDLSAFDLDVEAPFESTPGDPDDQRLEGCPPSESIVDLDAWFALGRDFGDEETIFGNHLVGRAPSAEQAAQAIAAFGRIGDCEAPAGSDFEGAELTGGPFAGIDGATSLEVRNGQWEQAVRFVAYHVDETVGVVILATVDPDPPPGDVHESLVRSAIERAG